ncbi:MAG: hypothetical protein PHQ98_04380 [Candidatus ainarchaeum sp.]|nr:hypothetical protein [Candidatus ainarchaeum sp.]
MKKKLIFIAIILIGLSLFLFINSNNGLVNQTDFIKIKSEYTSNDSLPTSEVVLNDYISRLSQIRSKSSVELLPVIDTELESAKTFFYYSKIILLFRELNKENCTQSKKTQLSNFLKMAIDSSNNYSLNYSKIIIPADKELLSIKNPELIANYRQQLNKINAQLNQIC